MPIYEYECKAGHVTEDFSHMTGITQSIECQCGLRATKIISTGAFKLDNWTPQYKSDLADCQKDPNAWCHTKKEYVDKCKVKGDKMGRDVTFITEKGS